MYQGKLIKPDFLFELWGIEKEVEATAAMTALFAMKSRCQELPERIQNKADLMNLIIPYASATEIQQARKLIKLIRKRGFN